MWGGWVCATSMKSGHPINAGKGVPWDTPQFLQLSSSHSGLLGKASEFCSSENHPLLSSGYWAVGWK